MELFRGNAIHKKLKLNGKNYLK